MFDVPGVTRVSLARNATSRQRGGDHAVLAHHVGLESVYEQVTDAHLRMAETPPSSNCRRTNSIITIWPIRWPNEKFETRLRLPYAPPRSTLFHSSAHHHLARSSGQPGQRMTRLAPKERDSWKKIKNFHIMCKSDKSLFTYILTYLWHGSPRRNVTRYFPAESAATNEISREYVPN